MSRADRIGLPSPALLQEQLDDINGITCPICETDIPSLPMICPGCGIGLPQGTEAAWLRERGWQ